MKSPLRAHAALLAMVIIWGVNFTVAKVALDDLSPRAFNALRFPLAALLLLVVLQAQGSLRLPKRADLPRALALGLLGNMLYQVCFIFGLDRTTAGNAALLLAGTPVLTALLSGVLGHEHVRPRVWVGLGCTVLGIALIVLSQAQANAGQRTITGDLLMLGASVAWACYTVGSRPLVDRHGPVLVTAWTLWAGTIGLVAIGWTDLMALDFAAVTLKTWAAVGYAGILSIGFAYMLWYYGVSMLGNARTGSYSNLTPVIALLGAWLWLGEKPHVAQLVGAAVIIAGITVAQSGQARPLPGASREG